MQFRIKQGSLFKGAAANGNDRLGVLIAALCVLALLFTSVEAQARIYKYQDENGKWHFSDKPITATQKQKAQAKSVEAQSSSALTTSTISSGNNAGEVSVVAENDLATLLTNKYQPQTAIETVTLAVVSIETPLSVGSGFFISEDGYILTNKHVIRPGDGKQFAANQERFEQAREKLDQRERWLKNERQRLGKMKRELDDYKSRIDRAGSGGLKNTAQTDYEVMLGRYNHWKKQYDEVNAEYKKFKAKIDSAESNFRIKTGAAQLQQRFKILLKDDTELMVELVSISRDFDLALLKLEGYRTPSLQAYDGPSVGQGSPVYAVGSPLGMRDHVTSGIVTRAGSNAIVTDATIMPGNSGGPLVDTEGKVLGINTQKVFSRSVKADGFGIAIPLPKAFETFAGKLP